MSAIGSDRIVVPRGARGWGPRTSSKKDPALRMLMNNLDPEVAERPRVPSGLRRRLAERRATGKDLDAIVATLRAPQASRARHCWCMRTANQHRTETTNQPHTYLHGQRRAAGRATRADSNQFRSLDELGLGDLRPVMAVHGVHRHAGGSAGHLRTFAAPREALRRDLGGRLC